MEQNILYIIQTLKRNVNVDIYLKLVDKAIKRRDNQILFLLLDDSELMKRYKDMYANRYEYTGKFYNKDTKEYSFHNIEERVLCIASLEENLEVVEYMLYEKGILPHQDIFTILGKRGNLSTLQLYYKYLLDKDLFLEYRKYFSFYAFTSAARGGHVNILEFIFQISNPSIISAFIDAIYYRRNNVIDYLLPFLKDKQQSFYHGIDRSILFDKPESIENLFTSNFLTEDEISDEQYKKWFIHAFERFSLNTMNYFIRKGFASLEDIPFTVREETFNKSIRSLNLEKVRYLIENNLYTPSNYKEIIMNEIQRSPEGRGMSEISRRKQLLLIQYLTLYVDDLDFLSSLPLSNIMREYLDEYQQNPELTRLRLQITYGRNIEWFNLIVFLSDNYLRIPENNTIFSNNLIRFARIVEQLPMEIQMKIANNLLQMVEENISSYEVEKYIRGSVLKYLKTYL